MKYCSIQECNNIHEGRSFCDKHLYRFRKFGSPLGGPRFREYHNRVNTTEYGIWTDIKKRCYNKNCKAYKNYGGRGITMHESWDNSFMQFLEDVGERPNNDLTLDRIDNDKGYEPGNVRWVNRTVQARNKRQNKGVSSGVRGIHKDRATGKWKVSISVKRNKTYLGYYNGLREAIEARKKAEMLYWHDLL